MIPAYLFGALFFLFLLLFLYQADRILFFRREIRRFEKKGKTPEYLAYLETKHKKTKSCSKKNTYLYLMYRALLLQGEKKKAEALFPFIRTDRLPGIPKETEAD